jgi:NarL family two-component system response regulator LiaR
VVQLVERLRPDVVVLDVGLPGMDGLACLDLLRARFPEVKVVMLSGMEEPAQARAALARGATAYIVKTIHPDDMVSALRQIVESTAFVAVPAAEGGSTAADHGLSDRELEILEHVSHGLTSAAIGRKLFVTEQTVKFHLTNVYRKLGVNNRTAASLEAHRRGIMRSPHADPAST